MPPKPNKMINETAVENAKKTDLRELIERLTGKQGKQQNGLIAYNCPFHNDRTPSFFIYPSNTYYCFGCSAHGDPITFVMEYLGMSFVEAVKYLNNDLDTDVKIPEFKKVEVEKKHIVKEVANSQLLLSFMSEIITSLDINDFNRVEEYLNKRKLSLVDFGWSKDGGGFYLNGEPILVPLPKGTANKNTYEIYNHIKKELLKEFSLEEIQEHRIFSEKSSVYAFFDFMFVYYGEGERGEAPVTNLQARKINASKDEIRELFIKNKVVLPFNMHLLSRLPFGSTIYLTEAPIDAVSLSKLLSNPIYPFSSAKNPYVVSTGGATIRADRLIQIAKERSMTIRLAMDNDTAGQTASEYWLKKFQDNNIIAKKFTGIPKKYKDANEYLVAIWDNYFS